MEITSANESTDAEQTTGDRTTDCPYPSLDVRSNTGSRDRRSRGAPKKTARLKDGVFICYKRKDCAALAGRVHDYLNAFFQDRLFMDVLNIMPGHDFTLRLRTVMDECRVIVVLIGPSWTTEIFNRSQDTSQPDYVVLELEQAIASGLTVIPLLVDGATMPDFSRLPVSIRALWCRHALEIRTHCFLRDIVPLKSAVYQACDLVPPTLWETFLASLPGVSIDERSRQAMAVVCVAFDAAGILGVALRDTYSIQSFIMFAFATGFGATGKNSYRLKWVGRIGLLLGVIGLAFLLVLLHRGPSARSGRASASLLVQDTLELFQKSSSRQTAE